MRQVWGMNNGQALLLALGAAGFFLGTVLARLIVWWRCASCILTW